MSGPEALPGPLPAGERMLWQGGPDWRTLARRAFHIRKLALYFGLLLAWVVMDSALRGNGAASVLLSFGQAAAAGTAALAIVAGYAWLVARGSRYTVTDRRVVIRIGLALPVTINLPYKRIDAAAVRMHADGAGDISLVLRGDDRLAYVILWPHARPWQFARAQPTLRGLRDAAPVATALSRALAASAGMPAPILVGDGALLGDVVPDEAVPHSSMAA